MCTATETAVQEGHVPIIPYVSDPSEPFPILVECGLLLLGVGPDYADVYPFLGSFELPPDAPPSLR